MSSTWYEVRYSDEIRAREVLKESEKTVTLKNGRQAKHSEYANFFSTEEEAVRFVYKRLTREIAGMETRLKSSREKLAAFSEKYPFAQEEVL